MDNLDFKNAQAEESAEMNPLHTRRVLVIGVGGGGCNALQRCIEGGIDGVKFIAVNTDVQALRASKAETKLAIGEHQTAGLGAGCNPEKGLSAAQESIEDIKALLQGADMVFITAGMGGGTGTGAAPVIAKAAQEAGALTVAVVTRPFKFEGKTHKVNAIRGIEALSLHSDSLLVIDNDKLLRNLGAGISIINAFRACDDVLYHAVQGITDFIVNTGFINVDFNDVITVMKGRGYAMIGTGYGKGANCTKDVVESAICSPLIDRIALSSAAGVLANLRISYNFSLQLIDEICSQLQEYANDDADCKFGFTYDDKLEPDEAFLTVLITGVDLQGSEDSQQIKSLNKNNIGNQNQQNRTEPVNLYPQSSMFNQNGSKPQLNAYQMLQSRQVGFGKDTSYENNAPYNNNMRGQSTNSFGYAQERERNFAPNERFDATAQRNQRQNYGNQMQNSGFNNFANNNQSFYNQYSQGNMYDNRNQGYVQPESNRNQGYAQADNYFRGQNQEYNLQFDNANGNINKPFENNQRGSNNSQNNENRQDSKNDNFEVPLILNHRVR